MDRRKETEAVLSISFLLLLGTTLVMAKMTGAPVDVDLGSGDQNSLQFTDLGRFAVEEHNKKANSLLEFENVVKAKRQVVAGILYHLAIEASEGGQKHLYEAKVWEKPWENFKELTEFKQADSPFTSSDLGVKQEEHVSGWRSVPTHDPIVQEAATHAVKTIQQRSNSLFPYELLEILDAKAEVIRERVVLGLHLKVKRGNKEEKFEVSVDKNVEGTYLLNHIQQEHT